MRTLIHLGLVVALGAGSTLTAQERKWTDAVWVMPADTHTYAIETATEVITATDQEPRGDRAITTTEGDRVSLAIVGPTVYVRDNVRGEHALKLVSRSAKYSRNYPAAGSGHFIKALTPDAAMITLEDGSRWDVDPRVRFDVVEWQPLEAISVRPSLDDPTFGYEIDNTDRDDGALANHRVR